MRSFRIAVAAAVGLLLTASASAQAPAQLMIQVWSYGFAPQPIHLSAGRPVTLTFVNRSGSSHDFTAPGFFQHAKIVGGGIEGDEVELRPHETKVVTLVPMRGTYQAHCSHFLHKQMGMSDAIIVD